MTQHTIAHVTAYFHGAFGYQENQLALCQAARGHRVHVLCSSRLTPWHSVPLDTAARWDQLCASQGVIVHRLPTLIELRRRPMMRGLIATLRHIRPTFIHVHGFLTLHTLVVALKVRSIGSIAVVDDHMAYVASRAPLAPLAHALCRPSITPLILRTYSSVVAVSEEAKAFMTHRYGIPPARIRVIPLGVNTSVFYPSQHKRLRFRATSGIDEGELLVVYSGKHDRHKDPLLLLRAAVMLWRAGLRFRVILVGPREPNYFSSLAAYLREHHLEDRVLLHDVVPWKQLADYYNAADVAVWPCEASMSALDALACACPVILPDLPTNRERTRSGGGLLFASGDVADLARALHRLLTDHELRKTCSARACTYARSLSWDAISERFLALATASPPIA